MTNFIEDLLRSSADGQRELLRAKLRVSVTERLLLCMEDTRVSRTELAARIGVSRSAVSQALCGSRNLSLDTLSDMAFAVGLRPEVTFTPLAQPQQRASGGIPVVAQPSAMQERYIRYTSEHSHVHSTN
jgi:transcriptional regulator with XRE-family HTH domain